MRLCVFFSIIMLVHDSHLSLQHCFVLFALFILNLYVDQQLSYFFYSVLIWFFFLFFFFLLFSMCLCRGLLVSVCVCVFSFSCAIYFIGLLIQGGGVFICPVCSRSLKSRPVLMKHMKLHDQNRKIYNCKLCSYTCNFGFNLKRHIATVHAKQAGIDSSPGNTNNNSSLAIMPTYNF